MQTFYRTYPYAVLRNDGAVATEFVEECDPSRLAHLQHHLLPTTDSRRLLSEGTDAGERPTETRPRRDVVDIAALKSQVGRLTLELAQVTAARCDRAMLLQPGYWQIQAQRQSQLRTAAQEENERLRAQLERQMRKAKRLTSVLKRNSIKQVC